MQEFNCQEDTSAEYLKRGHYGQVSLIEGEVNCPERQESVVLKGFALRSWIKYLMGGNSREWSSTQLNAFRSHDLIYHHQIGAIGLKGLDQNLQNSNGKFELARSVGTLVWMYLDQIKNKEEYRLGKILSDFMEVIPTQSSAKLFLAMSSPEIAEAINHGAIPLFRDIDLQASAVEAAVLLPQDARHRVFKEMGQISPGHTGDARRFSKLISAEWSNRQSSYCGALMIYRSMEGEEASGEVLEVQHDLIEISHLLIGS